jgi:hypothetical protein
VPFSLHVCSNNSSLGIVKVESLHGCPSHEERATVKEIVEENPVRSYIDTYFPTIEIMYVISFVHSIL